jgi:hypothetical protein
VRSRRLRGVPRARDRRAATRPLSYPCLNCVQAEFYFLAKLRTVFAVPRNFKDPCDEPLSRLRHNWPYRQRASGTGRSAAAGLGDVNSRRVRQMLEVGPGSAPSLACQAKQHESPRGEKCHRRRLGHAGGKLGYDRVVPEADDALRVVNPTVDILINDPWPAVVDLEV